MPAWIAYQGIWMGSKAPRATTLNFCPAVSGGTFLDSTVRKLGKAKNRRSFEVPVFSCCLRLGFSGVLPCGEDGGADGLAGCAGWLGSGGAGAGGAGDCWAAAEADKLMMAKTTRIRAHCERFISFGAGACRDGCIIVLDGLLKCADKEYQERRRTGNWGRRLEKSLPQRAQRVGAEELAEGIKPRALRD